ncbi:AGC family protein kinase [Tritrichomonas foetus]|uniref:non-specific serine/threonine protein kinase n=1 Tax=Tritrichomonas foetus TaxID=1144522 RepID=A0A1J4K6N7_9EUKA|nr:AGC family protein kinase [Tritrichomonas foetus]|eukprot:OHT05117.1 AGC family protein kinase [Tritrichomonas foetus]
MQDYHLLDQVGEGSFGRVFKARRKFTSRIVAIKMINKLGQSPDDLTSFRREIEILRRVDHPNIMRMIDVFETDTDFCVVSEFACGDLFQAVQDKNMPERAVRNIAAQLVSALKYLHGQHIIHRDLKPQNVLIQPKKIVKICDFGFARALSTTTLVLTSVKGTPLYMAPELVQEKPYDEKVDVWSLGVILYELFFGKPPFVTSSLYKLIPMIVENPIIFPGPISENFKSFLMMMLQKDPRRRASCEELQSHSFLARVKLSRYNDAAYIFKKEQFDAAIAESFENDSFRPSSPPIPDPETILKAPFSYSDEQILPAIIQIHEKMLHPSSPLVLAFASNFARFIQKPTLLDNTLMAATYILKKDPINFVSKFQSCIEILGDKNFPMTTVEFFTYLLCLPHAENIIKGKKTKIELKLNSSRSASLRDLLLGFLFIPDSVDIGETYSLISYFVQCSSEFLISISGDFGAQFMPIASSVIIMHPSPIVKSAALCILTRIISKNFEATQFIQPKKQFLDSLTKLLATNPEDIPSFCMFSATLSFLSMSLKYFDEFELNLEEIFKKERIKSLLKIGSRKPKTEAELLSYMSMIVSPFTHIPMKESLISKCISKIDKLMPVHQIAYLKRVFNLPFDKVLSFLPKLICLIENKATCEFICKLIIDVFKRNTSKSLQIATELVDCDALLKMASQIKAKNDPNSLYVLFALIIASFSSLSSPKLLSQAPIYLDALLSNKSSLETSLSVSSHLAKLSADFVRPIYEYGGLIVAEKGLKMSSGVTSTRASILIGNICRHASLPSHSAAAIIPLLMEQMQSTLKECPRWASYAIGNAIFQTPDLCEYVMKNVSPLIRLLKSKDIKTVENVAGIIGNIVKKSDKYLDSLIQNNVLFMLLETLDSKLEIGDKTIIPLSIFCQFEVAREYLIKLNAAEKIRKYLNSSNEKVQRVAKSMLKCLE